MAVTVQDRTEVAEIVARVRATLASTKTTHHAELDAALALSFQDRVDYQRVQSEAFASGMIAQATAQYLYRAIGESGSTSNGGWPAEADLADKVVVTQMIRDLVEARIAFAQARSGRR